MHKNRTPEWGRVSRSGFLSVSDQSGEINVSGAPPLLKPVRLLLGIIALGVAALSLPLSIGDSGWLVIGGVAAIIAAIYLWPYWSYYWSCAYRVRFVPAGVEFFNLFGVRIHALERAAMQQIAVEGRPYQKGKDVPSNLHFHVFYADDGYVSALPQKNERNALMRNAILISAFQQPVHLDGLVASRAA